MTNGSPLTPWLIWMGQVGTDVYNSSTPWNDIKEQFEGGYIALIQMAEPIPQVLGDYWTQSIVHVKSGIIPAGKNRLMKFDFTVPCHFSGIPTPEGASVEFFVGTKYQRYISFTLPELTVDTLYSRYVWIEGDGETNVDVFLRIIPRMKHLYFHGVSWRDY